MPNCSATVQNELLKIISNQITTNIVKQIGNALFFIIANETTDVGNNEQLCLAIRYVKEEDFQAPCLEQRFLKLRV